MTRLDWIINICANSLHSGGFLLEIVNFSMLCEWQMLKELSLCLNLSDSTKDSQYLVLWILRGIFMEE